jgi:hypothetical protein
MDALELINIAYPEHSRTSCSDTDLCNGWYERIYEPRFPGDTKPSVMSFRCTRCALLQIAKGDHGFKPEQLRMDTA